MTQGPLKSKEGGGVALKWVKTKASGGGRPSDLGGKGGSKRRPERWFFLGGGERILPALGVEPNACLGKGKSIGGNRSWTETNSNFLGKEDFEFKNFREEIERVRRGWCVEGKKGNSERRLGHN